jgi:glyoxalase superfamily protein
LQAASAVVEGTLMHKSRLGNIVIDCQTNDLLREAQFWSSALGYPLPPDLDESSQFIQLVTPPGEVQVIIQRVDHEARAHIDIETDSIVDEVARLELLGAVVISRKDKWIVMQAPSGHRFCVDSPYRGGFEQGANTWR